MPEPAPERTPQDDTTEGERRCDGSKRCGYHHAVVGVFRCCCGLPWVNKSCASGAKAGEPAPDDTTAPVTADPETVTASFHDVAQVAQHLKTYGEGEIWHAACRLLAALRVASEDDEEFTISHEPVSPETARLVADATGGGDLATEQRVRFEDDPVTAEGLRERLIQTVIAAGREVDVNAIRAIAADLSPVLEHAARQAAEVERLQAELAEASDALCAVGKAALVVAPTLAKPYPDAPKTSPWQQFMERPVRDAYNLGKRIRRDLKEARDAR